MEIVEVLLAPVTIISVVGKKPALTLKNKTEEIEWVDQILIDRRACFYLIWQIMPLFK